jgi:hypothetical protein
MSTTEKLCILCLVTLLIIIFRIPAAAEEKSTAQKNWEFNLAPMYLWAVNMSGDMTVRDQTQSLNLNFDQIFDNLEAVFTLHFEGLYKKEWGFLFDINYVNINDSTILPGPAATNVNVDFENVITELGGIYRFYEKGPHVFEGLGGARFWNLKADINITGVLPSLPRMIDQKQEWWDPIVGLRYRWQMSEKWMLNLRGDIGIGFGAGDTSDATWNAIGLIYFQPWKHVGFLGGYRALDVDYETGSGVNTFKYDMLMYGPIIAVNFTF